MSQNRKNEVSLSGWNPTASSRPAVWNGNSSNTGMPSLTPSRRKIVMTLGFWLVTLTASVAAVSAGYRACQHKETVAPAVATTIAAPQEEKEINTEWPATFSGTKGNTIINAEWLAPVAQILAQKQRPLRVLHIGDSHVAGRTLPLSVKEALQKELGAAESADSTEGVWFKYVGSNGATSRRFLTKDYMAEFREARPDLIILSLGTNESYTKTYDTTKHTAQLDRFFAELDSACPGAVVVLTTPPGCYLRSVTKGKNGKKVYSKGEPNPMVAKCAENIVSYGAQHHMPVWDLYTLAGGDDYALTNWIGADMMRSDRIHFNPSGYRLQGNLLGEAIANVLKQTLATQSK